MLSDMLLNCTPTPSVRVEIRETSESRRAQVRDLIREYCPEAGFDSHPWAPIECTERPGVFGGDTLFDVRSRKHLIFVNHELFQDGKWEDIAIHVHQQAALHNVMLIAKRFEAMSGKRCVIVKES
jgi:hypothetical protein